MGMRVEGEYGRHCNGVEKRGFASGSAKEKVNYAFYHIPYIKSAFDFI